MSNEMSIEKSEKIHFAVVGVGHIGKRHIEMINRNDRATLLAVCDIDPEQTLEFSDSFSTYSSLDAMLTGEPQIDVVCICTPNGLHIEQATKVIQFGSHVVIEKPMGLSKKSCELLLQSSLDLHKKVFCVMQNRYSPPSQWAKKMVSSGRIGDIYSVQINCLWNRDDRYYLDEDGQRKGWRGSLDMDGGPLFTQFSHFIDVLYWIFGDLLNIQAQFQNYKHSHSTDFEDCGQVLFTFTNGGMGSLNYTTAVHDTNMESSLTVVGSKGSFKIGGQYMNEVSYCRVEDYELEELKPVNPANDYGMYKGSAANHGYVIQNVVDVLTGNQSITTNAFQGLKVVEIIEKIYALRK